VLQILRTEIKASEVKLDISSFDLSSLQKVVLVFDQGKEGTQQAAELQRKYLKVTQLKLT